MLYCFLFFDEVHGVFPSLLMAYFVNGDPFSFLS